MYVHEKCFLVAFLYVSDRCFVRTHIGNYRCLSGYMLGINLCQQHIFGQGLGISDALSGHVLGISLSVTYGQGIYWVYFFVSNRCFARALFVSDSYCFGTPVKDFSIH